MIDMRSAVGIRFGVALAALALLSVLGFHETAMAQGSAQPPVTFTKDVAPILQEKCQSCHREGYMAPMPLVTYEESRPWARSIKSRVSARHMPPWHVDRTVGIQHFANDRSLTDEEIATIVRWVDSGNLHLTLKFLGNMQEGKLRAVAMAMEKVAGATVSPRLYLGPVGAFPTINRPRVLWVGLGGEVEALRELSTALNQSLARLGFPRETRPFSAHVTIGRVRENAAPSVLRQLGTALGAVFVPPIGFDGDEMVLYQSILGPGGPLYSSLFRCAMGVTRPPA